MISYKVVNTPALAQAVYVPPVPMVILPEGPKISPWVYVAGVAVVAGALFVATGGLSRKKDLLGLLHATGL